MVYNILLVLLVVTGIADAIISQKLKKRVREYNEVEKKQNELLFEQNKLLREQNRLLSEQHKELFNIVVGMADEQKGAAE